MTKEAEIWIVYLSIFCSQYHDCLCLSFLRHQGISSSGIDLILTEYSTPLHQQA